MTRIAVFIDYQNTYMRAREVFGDGFEEYTFGQVYPRRLGVLLKQRGEIVDADRHLESVRVYRGEPDAERNPIGQLACESQVRFWSDQALVRPNTRPLRYRATSWTDGRPTEWDAREKGIDVLLAVDMVVGATRDEFDVAVLFSGDTDLLPAVEAVERLGKRVEVAAWRPDDGPSRRLSVPGSSIWCHWLDRRDFEMVRDDTDYTVAERIDAA